MSMFKGVQPAGQPRTVRSNIARFADQANFPAEPMPPALPEAKENWPAVAPTPRRAGGTDKNPFGGMR
jgi:hypothetical protein